MLGEREHPVHQNRQTFHGREEPSAVQSLDFEEDHCKQKIDQNRCYNEGY